MGYGGGLLAGDAPNSFWPWAMSGPNAVRPTFNASPTRYDHLDRVMKEGELVRLDDSCSVAHYESDLGRTVPVSGRFTAEQREISPSPEPYRRLEAKAISPKKSPR